MTCIRLWIWWRGPTRCRAGRNCSKRFMGMRSLDDIETLIAFFEARFGQLFAFRWKDWSDYRSSKPSQDITAFWGMVKQDRFEGADRVIELWEPMRSPLETGALVRLIAGCDKRSETCRAKFANLTNFQGFPDVPGEDWMLAVPNSSGANTGGRLR